MKKIQDKIIVQIEEQINEKERKLQVWSPIKSSLFGDYLVGRDCHHIRNACLGAVVRNDKEKIAEARNMTLDHILLSLAKIALGLISSYCGMDALRWKNNAFLVGSLIFAAIIPKPLMELFEDYTTLQIANERIDLLELMGILPSKTIDSVSSNYS